MHSLLSPEKRDGHQVRRASVLFGLYFPYFFLAWLPQCGRVPSRPVNPYSWASAQAMPRATDRSQPSNARRLFGRCANRNSARVCTVGTILAGCNAAYNGPRVGQPFCVERGHKGESK